MHLGRTAPFNGLRIFPSLFLFIKFYRWRPVSILGNSSDVKSMQSLPERSFVRIMKEMINRFPFDLTSLELLSYSVLLGYLAFNSMLDYFSHCIILSPSTWYFAEVMEGPLCVDHGNRCWNSKIIKTATCPSQETMWWGGQSPPGIWGQICVK